tara:strand:+ start:376 stop:1077 length:702 start_codon:yes stop_codon:yes gene_type:complete
MYLFYTNSIKKNNYTLSAEESRHGLKSLRKKINEKIMITEGNGVIHSAFISEIKNQLIKYTLLKVVKKNDRKTHIHLAISPIKNRNRFEWFIEKVTEIGVDTISPLICDKSEKKIINKNRCEKIMIAAMKQSKNCILPTLHSPIDFQEFVSLCQKNTYLAHCHATEKKKLQDHLICLENKKNITLFIGPEGDFSEKEVNFALNNGIIPVELSKSTLRTETAGVVGCNIINLFT